LKTLTDREWAYVTLRMTLGVNMLMHGLTRVIGGVGAFVGKVSAEFDGGFLPIYAVQIFLFVLPFVELTIGLLMVLGLATRWALIAGGFTITMLTFGSTAMQNWSAAGVQLPYAIAFFILLFTREYNKLCLDRLSSHSN